MKRHHATLALGDFGPKGDGGPASSDRHTGAAPAAPTAGQSAAPAELPEERAAAAGIEEGMRASTLRGRTTRASRRASTLRGTTTMALRRGDEDATEVSAVEKGADHEEGTLYALCVWCDCTKM